MSFNFLFYPGDFNFLPVHHPLPSFCCILCFLFPLTNAHAFSFFFSDKLKFSLVKQKKYKESHSFRQRGEHICTYTNSALSSSRVLLYKLFFATTAPSPPTKAKKKLLHTNDKKRIPTQDHFVGISTHTTDEVGGSGGNP